MMGRKLSHHFGHTQAPFGGLQFGGLQFGWLQAAGYRLRAWLRTWIPGFRAFGFWLLASGRIPKVHIWMLGLSRDRGIMGPARIVVCSLEPSPFKVTFSAILPTSVPSRRSGNAGEHCARRGDAASNADAPMARRYRLRTDSPAFASANSMGCVNCALPTPPPACGFEGWKSYQRSHRSGAPLARIRSTRHGRVCPTPAIACPSPTGPENPVP
jgi:hypothetical protein